MAQVQPQRQQRRLCVEVADLGTAVAIRDSKNPDHGALLLTRDQWAAFLTDVKGGEFDQ